MKKRFTKPAPFWMSWGSVKSIRPALPVSVLDRPGVFETMRVYAGRTAVLSDHLRRLRESAKTVGLHIPSEKILTGRLQEAIGRSGFLNAIARLSVHASGPDTVLTACSVRPFAGYPADWYTEGISIATASVRRAGPRELAAQVKGNDYANAVAAVLSIAPSWERASEGSVRRRSSDPMMLTAAGEVSETTVANILVLRDGTLWTAPAACGILLGVTRRLVLESAREKGLKVRETPFTRHDLFNADEVFLTNAAAEVLPVVEVDKRLIGNGSPGPWAERLRAAYLQRATK